MVFIHTVKRRLKHYSWRFNPAPDVSETSSTTSAFKTFEAETYMQVDAPSPKGDSEAIGKKLIEILDQIEKKLVI